MSGRKSDKIQAVMFAAACFLQHRCFNDEKTCTLGCAYFLNMRKVKVDNNGNQALYLYIKNNSTQKVKLWNCFHIKA